MSKTVVALFPHPEDAQGAVSDLTKMGVSGGSVQTMTSDARGQVLDALTSRGVPSGDAHTYAEGVRRGGALVAGTVEDGQADQAVSILNRHNTIDIDKLGARYREGGHTGFDASLPAYTDPDLSTERDLNRQITIPIVEEQLSVGKRQVQAGGARIHTHVVETPASASVTLREEHVAVERHAVDRPVSDADAAFKEQNFQVTETAEVPVVSKTAHVVEEVTVGKAATERTETVSDTVRRTEVDVEETATDAGTTRR